MWSVCAIRVCQTYLRSTELYASIVVGAVVAIIRYMDRVESSDREVAKARDLSSCSGDKLDNFIGTREETSPRSHFLALAGSHGLGPVICARAKPPCA